MTYSSSNEITEEESVPMETENTVADAFLALLAKNKTSKKVVSGNAIAQTHDDDHHHHHRKRSRKPKVSSELNQPETITLAMEVRAW